MEVDSKEEGDEGTSTSKRKFGKSQPNDQIVDVATLALGLRPK